MKKLFDILRLIFISLEFLYLLVLLAIGTFYPEVFSYVGARLQANSDILKWIPVLPLAICGVAFKLSWQLTSPLSGSNRELYEWPDYWQLAYRRNISLLLCAIMAAVAISLWIFASGISSFAFGMLFLLSLGIAVIVMSTMVFAGFKIKEIVEPRLKP